MKAIVYDEALKLIDNYEKPTPEIQEVLIRPTLVGICNTDEEILKGYMNYKGVLGHEFVGKVIDAPDKNFIGKRVVGEINLGCKHCMDCSNGLERHCKYRKTLGIYKKDGCFSEAFTLPLTNILIVPDSVNDETAVFIEPLAAAYEIFEQVHIKPDDRVALVGDGKLGLSISIIMNALNIDYIHIGKHENKLQITKNLGGQTKLLSEVYQEELKTYDVVIEATGSISGFETSLSLVRPRGTLILKSTIAANQGLNLAPVVVDEIKIIGSRCGQFKPVLRLMEKGLINTKPLISEILPFDMAIEAFELNRKPETIKVLMKL